MIEEFQKLRREIRADFEMMSARQNDMAKRLDEHAQATNETLKMLMGQNAKMFSELSETTRWVEGRLRLTNDRFDAVLGAVENALESQKVSADQKIDDLAKRVEALERDKGTAA
ncbi:hypothetical protein IV102_37645 [bacterium]|nr:hypothetical protein [bacterium]